MVTRRALAAVLLLGACSGQPGSEPAEPQRASGALVGGREASATEYPATVLIDWGCTGAKVGPRLFLTAAHCVHDSKLNVVNVGSQLLVTTKDANLFANDAQALGLEAIHVMPSWIEACAPWLVDGDPDNGCTANVLSASHPPDVALIAVTTDTPSIPEAVIDVSPVQLGDHLVETGYGCENGYDKPFDYDHRRLKLERSVAIGAERLLHDGSFVWAGDEGNVAASYVITPGFDAGSGRDSSLCPGDSGGPLYRDEPSQLRVVGVNAYYTFPNDGLGVSATDWHTRLDVESRFGVASWLTELGANVIDGRCQPMCEGKSCGSDGCGGECGSCADGDVCTLEGQCEAVCVPSCEGKVCGDDGCGGSCGECEADAGVEPPVLEPDAGDSSGDDDLDQDEDEADSSDDEAAAGVDCEEHPGSSECAIPVTSTCQVAARGARGGSWALLLGLAPLLMVRSRRRWRLSARAANLGA
jgi:hypothetical protein